MLTAILVSLLAFLLYLSTRKPKNFPPGPPRLPVVGSLPFMAGSGPSPSLLHGIIKQVKKHGPIFGFYFGKTPAVIIADYHLVSKSLVYQNNPNHFSLKLQVWFWPMLRHNNILVKVPSLSDICLVSKRKRGASHSCSHASQATSQLTSSYMQSTSLLVSQLVIEKVRSSGLLIHYCNYSCYQNRKTYSSPRFAWSFTYFNSNK